jgi:hypothetical protein
VPARATRWLDRVHVLIITQAGSDEWEHLIAGYTTNRCIDLGLVVNLVTTPHDGVQCDRYCKALAEETAFRTQG